MGQARHFSGTAWSAPWLNSAVWYLREQVQGQPEDWALSQKAYELFLSLYFGTLGLYGGSVKSWMLSNLCDGGV